MIKKGIKFYKEIVMSQVAKSNSQLSRDVSDRSVKFAQSVHDEYSRLEESKSYSGRRMFEDDNSDNKSDSRVSPSPEGIQRFSRKPRDAPGPEIGGKPPRKAKKKLVRKKKKSKSKNREVNSISIEKV